MSARINLLPWREMRRKEQNRQLLSIGIGAWVLMGLIVFYAHLHVSGLIDNQNKRNDFLQQETAKLDNQIKEINELKKQRAALIARMQVIQRLQGNRTQIVHVFDDLVRRLPEGVYLTSLRQQGNGLVLTGTAQSNARVSAFMRNLDGSDWFANPDLDVVNVVRHGGDRVSNFTLRVSEKTSSKKKKS